MESVTSILKCPVSNEPLSLTRLSELNGVSTHKIADELSLLESALDTAWDKKELVTPDKQYFYPIIDNIFILLPELCLTAAKKGEAHQAAWDRERVQYFYNKFGWTRKEGGGAYEDTKMFLDQRDLARDYQIRAEEKLQAIFHQALTFSTLLRGSCTTPAITASPKTTNTGSASTSPSRRLSRQGRT